MADFWVSKPIKVSFFPLQAVAMDALSLEQQLPPYPFFTQTSAQQQQQTQVASALPPNAPLMQTTGLQRGVQLPPLSVTVPSTIPQSPPGSQTQTSMGIDISSVSLTGKEPWRENFLVWRWVPVDFPETSCIFIGAGRKKAAGILTFIPYLANPEALCHHPIEATSS